MRFKLSRAFLHAIVFVFAAGAFASDFTGIDHVTINVRDLQAAEAWYTAMLGFSVETRTTQYSILQSGTVRLVLNRATSGDAHTNPVSSPGIYHVAFTVPALSQSSAIAHLRAESISVELSSSAEHRSAFFHDPEGNALEYIASAPGPQRPPAERLDWLGDVLLDHLEDTSPSVRTKRGLTGSCTVDLSPDAANAEAVFSRSMLAALDRINAASLSHDQQLLADILRQQFVVGASADDDYWYQFLVTPYTANFTLRPVLQCLAVAPVKTENDRMAYLKMLDEYASMIRAMADKTRLQAARGIRLAKPAIAGARAMLHASSESIAGQLSLAGRKNIDGMESLEEQVQGRVQKAILPAYQALLSVLGPDYERLAPAIVGQRQYPDRLAFYQRCIRAQTSLNLTPEVIHARGLRAVRDIETKMTTVRKQLGFRGSAAEFKQMLRRDPRFFATSPEEVERHYVLALARISGKLPEFFAVLPKAPYGVARAAESDEAGMTYGYYDAPHPGEPRGMYRYNGSNLKQRSLVTAAHLIYHELIPGHHLRFALAAESSPVHPVLEFLSDNAVEEGWAEYAAELAGEMGGFSDPYDLYGHLLMQSFVASRLVVDTGLNALGWSLERARRYLHEHSFESDRQIETETLRYSTDLPGQALGYRLGYEALIGGRHEAEKALGSRFQLREFDTAVSNHGSLPLNVLQQQIHWYINQARAQ